MNKHLYRIVFNHALGLVQVVSELVRRPGRGASKQGGIATTTVRPISLGLWAVFGWIGFAFVASAQIATDMHAQGNQRPTVVGAPNAAPLINITTPSKAGVSRNTYADFNVTDAGAVLNNARTNTQTRLAGVVAGNPWLATGTAKVILNEVTGPNPSRLNGYIEVAGDRAQVAASGADTNVLAVTGSFDNGDGGTLASNGDLTLQAAELGNAGGSVNHAGTGTLHIDAANLNGTGGTIASNGLLTVTGNTTDLSGGTTYAQRVAIATGTLRTAGGSLTALGPDALSQEGTSFASQITARDMLDNTGGTIATNGALQLAAGSLDNTQGTLTAGGTSATQVTVAHTFTNTAGTLAAMGATTVRAGSLINRGGTLSTQGTRAASPAAQGSPLSVAVAGLLDNSANGTLTSDGDLNLTAATIDNTQGTIAHAGPGALTIDAAALNGRGGTIASNGALTLTGTTTDLSGGTTYAQKISIATGTLSHAGGTLTALGTDALSQEGTSFASQITARNALDNTHDSVSDSIAIGSTISGDSVTMAAGHDLTATAAQVVADHDIVMAAGNNLTLNTANGTHTEEHSTSKTKSGLMGNGGPSVTLGNAKQSHDVTLTQTTPEGTAVGSLGGNVTMSAGNTLHLQGSTVASLQGDVTMIGRSVNIEEAHATSTYNEVTKTKQSGLTLGVSAPVVDAAVATHHAAKTTGRSNDARVNAMAAANTGYAAYQTAGDHNQLVES